MRLVKAVLLLSLSLLACSLVPPRVLPAPTAVPPVMETIPSLPTPAQTETPTSLPSVTLSAADFTPILYSHTFFPRNEFQVIGGVQGGNWLPADVVADKVQLEQAFDLYAPTGYAGVAITEYFTTPSRCGGTYVGSKFSMEIPHLIGVAQGWDVTLGSWLETSVDTPVYYAAVADWLVSQGFTLPAVQITRILRVDLEGDGVEEVFISAAYFKDESGHMAEQGDYSIILMRKLVGNEVVTVPVVADLYTSPTAELAFPFTYSLASLLDLNQDRNLDLIVEVTRWEGGGVIIYQIDGTNVIPALQAICTQ